MSKPSKIDVFAFLDLLRDSALINMYGAALSIVKEFEITKPEARNFLKEYLNQK